jgi:hypothetical protein
LEISNRCSLQARSLATDGVLADHLQVLTLSSHMYRVNV